MINRGEDNFMCQLYRMTEFYNFEEMDYYFHNIKINGYDIRDAMTFLDYQTRAKYIVDEKKPNIADFLISYIFGKDNNLENLL